MSFQLSDMVDQKKVFLVKKNDIEERIDPNYYRPYSRRLDEIYELVSLREHALLIKHPPEHKRIYADIGIQLIRSQNVRSTGIDLQNAPVFLAEDVMNKVDDIYPEIGDVLVVRSGANAGDIAVVDIELPNTVIGADTLLIRFNSNVKPKFIQTFFSLKIGKELIDRYLTGATNKHVSPYYLGKIKIPLPPPDIQDQIIAKINTAYVMKKEKEAVAKSLLHSIDNYLLQELEIELPEEDENTIQYRMFSRKFNEITGGRFDAASHWKRLDLSSDRYPSVKLTDLVFINPPTRFKDVKDDDSISFVPMDAISEIYGEIEVAKTRPACESGAYTTFQEGDIIWAKITPCMENGKSAIAENLVDGYGFGSTEFHVFRSRNPEIRVQYLHALLRLAVVRDHARLFFGGTAGHQRVDEGFFRRLEVPFPPPVIQDKLIETITRRKKEARRLVTEAGDGVRKAKEAIEAMILGKGDK